ncbi:HPP family protein [Solidesulfovibrio sp.]|uniref:HPP family protein n=1 Tax=Solidesulfovibrio sp. TaxID=2910990 RepID=UPI002B1FAB05|nr:HPP family protein [Solidesulfovibrio sp.]MEA5089691.1 HPP family protein [Solidesulfovibrio sp.]
MFTKSEYITMLFVVCMVAVAEYFKVNEIIFPEIAALTFGAWVMEERPWRGPAWTICFSPTLGALTGVVLLRLAPHALLPMVGLAFFFILIELKLFRSAMSPSFSAAILPILTGITSWVYPISVCVMAAIIAGVAHCREKGKAGVSDDLLPAATAKSDGHAGLGLEMLHYGKLLLFVLLVAIFSVKSEWLFVMSPPLIVAFVELAEPGSVLRKKSMFRLLLLFSIAALCGMIWVFAVTQVFQGPMWLAAGLAVASVFLLVRRLGVASPPAFALALLPTILPHRALYLYPVHVLIGSALFIGFSLLWFRSPGHARG